METYRPHLLASTLMQSTNHGVSEMTVQVANIFGGVGCQVPVRAVGQTIMQKQGRRSAIQLTAKTNRSGQSGFGLWISVGARKEARQEG
jgi:hypothetical protein